MITAKKQTTKARNALIIALRAAGVSIAELADRFWLHPFTVRQILKGARG
jgi:transposase